MPLLPDNHLARALLPGGEIISLPNWSQQRVLFLAEDMASRWHKSKAYPAFRTPAKLYRLFLRTFSSLGLMPTRKNPADTWLLGDFIKDAPLEATSAVIVIGMPGLAQKITVQLWNGSEVVGYLKYAEQPAAETRLANEHRVLLSLPDGLGPKILKYGDFLNGSALVTTPVFGRPLAPKLPPAQALWTFLETCQTNRTEIVDDHPWLQFVQEHYGQVALPWLEALSNKPWPVVLHHGDFTPWNILQTPEGAIRVIDWECSKLRGFPYLDIIYFILQIAVLLKHWAPQETKRYVLAYLGQAAPGALSEAEAEALINLTAYHAYKQAVENGHTKDDAVQRWRRKVWETKL